MMKAAGLTAFLAGTTLIVSSVECLAASPVALVEEVRGNVPGVEFMDYLDAGKTIQLGPRDTIVLSYLKSCLHETITGGAVTIGIEQSEVSSGTVVRDPVACDTGRMTLTDDRAKQSAGTAFRGKPVSKSQFTVHGLSPILELQAPGRLEIDRIDQSDQSIIVDVDRDHLLHGMFYDFAQSGRTLVPGGMYRAVFGQQQVVFRVDPLSDSRETPVISRIVRFKGSN